MFLPRDDVVPPSGAGCRPSNNGMFYANADALATLAGARGGLGGGEDAEAAAAAASSYDALAANFSARAAEIRAMYTQTSLLWDDARSVTRSGSEARSLRDTSSL